MATQPVASDEYQPLVWQVVVDGLGYSSVHETDEDGKPGDLVAHTYGDHIQLIAAAPALLAVAQMVVEASDLSGVSGPLGDAARIAIANATGIPS